MFIFAKNLYMKRIVNIIAVVFLLAVMPILSNAQPPDPNSGGTGTGGLPPGPGNTPTGGGAPIDGGLSIMLLLGAAYGTKKLTIKK